MNIHDRINKFRKIGTNDDNDPNNYLEFMMGILIGIVVVCFIMAILENTQ